MLSFPPMKGRQWFISNHTVTILHIHGLQKFLTLNLKMSAQASFDGAAWVQEGSVTGEPPFQECI